MKMKKLTFLTFLLVLAYQNLIISVDTTDSYVSQSATVSVLIKTSTSINLLKI